MTTLRTVTQAAPQAAPNANDLVRQIAKIAAQESTERVLEAISPELVSMLSRLQALETKRLDYVNPRLTPDVGERERSVMRKLSELLDAVRARDDIEMHAIALSIRRDLKAVRDAAGTPRGRRFALSYVYDALTFTPLSRLDSDTIDILAQAFAFASGPTMLDDDELWSIRSGLEKAGFELTPVPQD